jgi:hypothetical protein
MPSRRDFLVSASSGLVLLAGCIGGEDTIARCSSKGSTGTEHLRAIAPITGDEQVALGVVVSDSAIRSEALEAITVRDRDGELVATIPLDTNREMSRLDPEEYPVFNSEDGELYAVPLGSPPQHGEFEVSLVDPAGEPVETGEIQFNCYSYDGDMP